MFALSLGPALEREGRKGSLANLWF